MFGPHSLMNVCCVFVAAFLENLLHMPLPLFEDLLHDVVGGLGGWAVWSGR